MSLSGVKHQGYSQLISKYKEIGPGTEDTNNNVSSQYPVINQCQNWLKYSTIMCI